MRFRLPVLTKQQLQFLATTFVVLFGTFEPFIFPSSAQAVAVTGYIRLDRMAASATTGGLVCMTPQASATAGKTVITFPGTGTQGTTSFGVNTTTTNWTVATTSIPSGTTAWPGIGTATAVSGAAVTFPTTAMTNGTQYCFTFSATSTLSNPTGAATNLTGSIQTQTSGGAALETVNYALAIVSNDQISVTATVPPTFSFSLSGNTAALGTLATSGNPTTATAITATISTNAQNGWVAWVKNTNANSALISSSTSDGICLGANYPTCTGAAFTTGVGNVHSLSGAAGYGVSGAAGTGSPTIATEYAGSSTSFGSLDSTKFEKIASNTAPASGNTFTLTVGAEASPTNKAATDYADTITLSGAGQF